MAYPSESSEQQALVKRLRRTNLCFSSVPNGAHLLGGDRAGALLKAEGLENGVPDLLVFSPPTQLVAQAPSEVLALAERLRELPVEHRRLVAQLAGVGPGSGVEMKKFGGGSEPEGSLAQQAFGGRLKRLGWRWGVFHGWRAAWEGLENWGYDLTYRRRKPRT